MRSAPAVLDLDVAGNDVDALAFHIGANALFYGLLALMIGAWTGNNGTASGAAAAIMLVSYFAAGLLPLVSGLADFARAFPWYYYDGSEPLANGADWGHLAVLFGASALFVATAVIGFNRRDLGERATSVVLIDRLRSHPITHTVMERLEGSARVSRIAVKSASDHRGLLIIAGLIIFAFGVMMGPLYLLVEEELRGLAGQYPDAILAMVGDADFSTPEGWYQVENFSLTLPVTVISVVIVMGSSALAGEEQRRTMGLLLANPISRSREVLEKAAAMVAYAFILGFLAFLSTAIGSLLGGLGISMANIAVISLLLALLGLVFGSAALALSAATGRGSVAAYGAAGLTLVFFLINSFLPLDENLADFTRLSPFYYYLTSDPLVNGMNWSHAAILATSSVGLVALAVKLFDRRDLRQ